MLFRRDRLHTVSLQPEEDLEDRNSDHADAQGTVEKCPETPAAADGRPAGELPAPAPPAGPSLETALIPGGAVPRIETRTR